MPLRQIDWQFVSDLGEDDERVDFLNESMDNMSHSWNDHIVDALLAVFYGWSCFSITYENVGGRLLWRKFKMLGHDTVQEWLIADDGGIEGLKQWPHLWKEPIPIERMLLYRLRKTQNNPEGESILRPAWTSWYYIKNLQHHEAIGLERNIAGYPMIRLPEGADTTSGGTDMTAAEQLVRNVRQDEQAGIVLPYGWEFELIAGVSGTGMSRGADTDRTIVRYEKRMLMAALAQFLMIGQENVGALSTFEGGADFFTMSVAAIADIIAETFSKYAIPRLLEYNGLDTQGVRLEHGRVGNTDLAKMADFLQKSGAMLNWTPADEIWLRDLAKLPEVSLEELQELEDEKAIRKEEAMARLEQANQQRQENMLPDMRKNMMPDMEQDAAEYYAAGRASDDALRMKHERGLKRAIMGFWDEQEKRVIKGAEAKRGQQAG